MTRKLLSAISILASICAFAQDATAIQDTLLNANKAQNISIISTPHSTSITVHNLEYGTDSFFYQTGTQGHNGGSFSKTQINCPDISNVVVCESDSCVAVDYLNADGKAYSYTFAFADPDNRTLKTYIGTKGSDFGFTISRNHTTKWEAVSSGLGFGWGTPVDAPSGLDANMWHSNEFFWNMILGVRMTHRAQALSLGFGIRWQTVNIRDSHYFHKMSDGRLSLMPFSDDQTEGMSSLKFFSMQVPLMYAIGFGHNRCCSFSFGPILNFNTGAHINTKFKEDGREYKITTRDLSQRIVTVDAMASFSYKAIGIYARYAPMKRFNSKVDFDFGTFSTGIILSL